MTKKLSVIGAFVAALAMSLCVTASAQDLDEATFSFKTDFMVSLTGYVLPPGQYTLTRMNSTDVFQLRKDGPDTKPIAMIDTWNTQTPKAVDSTTGTEAVLTVLDPKAGESVRALEGFSIKGDYFKIRDVLAISRDLKTSN